MTASALALTLLLASCWALVCRINYMQHGITQLRVFLQHAALAIAIVIAIFLPGDWASVALGAGILVFLVTSSSRWHPIAPAGTRRESK